MKTTLLIATDSIRALLHQRLLLGLMLASLALTIFFSITLTSARKSISASFSDDEVFTNSIAATNRMSEAEQRRFRESMEEASTGIQAGFYGVTSFGGSLVALFIFGSAVASEIRKGTIRLTLAKPVSRSQFLLGKYLGGVVVMAGYALLASIAILVFAQSLKVELSPAIKWGPWLMFCRQLMLGSLAMLLSLFFHQSSRRFWPTLPAMVFIPRPIRSISFCPAIKISTSSSGSCKGLSSTGEMSLS